MLKETYSHYSLSQFDADHKCSVSVKRRLPGLCTGRRRHIAPFSFLRDRRVGLGHQITFDRSVRATTTRDPRHSPMAATFAKVISSMDEFSILTNRKRAIVALVHSVVFLLIAVRQMVTANPAAGIWVSPTVSRGTWILCGIFTIVSSILLWLLLISRGWLEKLYFGFCTTSATSGLLRTAAGDQAFHAGLYIRVIMLVSAVVVGVLIVRMHSRVLARVPSEYAEEGS